MRPVSVGAGLGVRGGGGVGGFQWGLVASWRLSCVLLRLFVPSLLRYF